MNWIHRLQAALQKQKVQALQLLFTPSNRLPESSGQSQAWIAGPIVPSVVVVLLLAGVAFWWYRRRKGASAPQDDQETAQFDKPQLHSECVPRPSHGQAGSVSPIHQGHVHSSSYAEMPANEAPAYELSAEGRRRMGGGG